MALHHRFFPRVRFLAGILCLSLIAIASSGRSESIKETTSLKFVPADVSFYSAMLRNREQFDLLMNSKAIAKLKQLPVIQMGLGMLKLQWENPQQEGVIAFKDFWQQEENQELKWKSNNCRL